MSGDFWERDFYDMLSLSLIKCQSSEGNENWFNVDFDFKHILTGILG